MSRQLSQKHHNIEENTLSSSWPIGCKKRSMEDYQKKQLDYLAEEMRKGKKVNPSLLLAGTRIVKKYHGEEHEVIVKGYNAFVYRGKPYKSLSAIANEITGTRWNGLKFFNVKNAKAN